MRQPDPPGASPSEFRRDVASVLFLLLLASYAYFWQARGWNNGTRLALTYSLVDRGTLRIDGLEEQTRDRAFIGGHFYCDKPPGQSFLGAVFYRILSPFLEAHPVDSPAIIYWWPDYVLTLLTSGVGTAVLAVLLYTTALRLGCSQKWAVTIALAYGLATPAWPYATLFFGHQTAALLSFGMYMLMEYADRRQRWRWPTLLGAGLLAGAAVATEYHVVGTSILGAAYVASQCPSKRLALVFVIGAAVPAAALATYHTAAFGGPFELGYFHETEQEFREIYSAENPIGLTAPTAERARALIFSPHGLVWYAPVLLVAPIGAVILVRRRRYWTMAFAALPFACLFLINASHPTWWGGWTSGPRYLVPAFPFLFLGIAGLAATPSAWRWCIPPLALFGYFVCLGCTAWTWGGQLPDYDYPGGDNPLLNILLPDVIAGKIGPSNVGNRLFRGGWQYFGEKNWVSLLPLLDLHLFGGTLLYVLCGRRLARGPAAVQGREVTSEPAREASAR